jgi:hypothetical protein
MGRDQNSRGRVTGRTWIVLALVAIALVVLWRIGRRGSEDTYETSPAPADWGGDPDDVKWNDEAAAIPHTALANARGVAEKWGATVAALTGVFGVVVFAKGPDALTDIPGDDAYAVLALALLAVLAAALATFCGALAAQGTPTNLNNLNGWTLKQLYSSRLPQVLKLLRWSRLLTVAAVLLIFGAVTIGWLSALDARGAAKGQNALVIQNDGSVLCGEIKRQSGGLVVDTGSGVPKPLANVRQVVIVDSCPK